MELTVNKDDLAKALNNVEGIASAKQVCLFLRIFFYKQMDQGF